MLMLHFSFPMKSQTID